MSAIAEHAGTKWAQVTMMDRHKRRSLVPERMVDALTDTLDALFPVRQPQLTTDDAGESVPLGVSIVEGLHGMFHYHLRADGEGDALCGEARVMTTRIPLSAWGIRTEHLNERYCRECAALAKHRLERKITRAA